MKPRAFNSVMHPLNESWAAAALGMTRNPGQGIDLLGDTHDVEVKFNLRKKGKYVHKSWRVLGHEVDWGKNGRLCYWALGFYMLDREVKSIKPADLESLEKRVLERELFIVAWDWIDRYPVYHHRGETDISKWDHDILFPKYRDLPRTIFTYTVKKGIVHLTEGVDKGLLA